MIIIKLFFREVKTTNQLVVGGWEHEWIILSIQLGNLSSQLTFIFFRGVETTTQR